MPRMLVILTVVAFQALSLTCIDAISSMAIDMGTEFMKVAVVLPGMPMEIALNADSKRKTSTAVGFKNNERVFASHAVNLASKCPECVYQSVPSLLGKTLNHPMVKVFQERYPYHNLSYDSSTGQLFFTQKDGTVYSVDELVGMLLEYAHDYAEQYSGSEIKTCVLTVPSYFSQAERRRLMYAAKIAGLNVLQLINDNAAVALNFGLFRHKSFNDTPQYYAFFDIGSMSTTATLAAYTFGKNRDGDVTGEFPMLRIVNVSHDPILGTMAFIYRIRDLLVEKFSEAKKKNKNLVIKNNRAMSKLTQEASNVLMKLSANNEIFAQVENVFDGEDLRVKVTRAEMESLCSDLFERIRKPFLDMMSDTPLESLQEVILMGGGTRIPKVQSVLIELSKKTELHKGVNSDEAAALGAVYQAAFHTPGFRVTRFIVKDYNPYPIAVDFMRAPASSDEKLNKDSKTDAQSDSPYIRQVLFPRGAVFPQRRTIKFNRHVNDLDFYVNYADLDGFAKSFLGPNYNLSHVTTRNVSKSAKQYSFAEPRGVKAHFTMDHNGVLILSGVSCIFHPIEKTETSGDSAKAKSTFEKIGNTLSGLFGGGGGGKSDEEKSSDHDANVNEAVAGGNSTGVNMTTVNNGSTTSDNQTISSHDTDTNSGQSQQDSVVKPTAPFPEPIDYEINYVDFPQLPSDVLASSLSKLNKLREADKAKAALEASINQLETLLIDIRDKISTDYAKYGAKEEIIHLEGVLQIISDWFDETGHEGTKDEYDSRIQEMQVLINPIEKRRIEAKHRPKAMSSFDKTLTLADKTLAQMIELSNLFAQTLKAMPVEQNESTTGSERSWSNVFTEMEIQTFTNKINETKTWLAQSTDALNKSPTQQDPPVLVSDIQAKEKELSREIVYHTTKMDLWRSEIARMFAEQAKMNTTASRTVKPDEGEKVVKGSDDKPTVEPVVIQKDEESKKSTQEPTPTPRPEL